MREIKFRAWGKLPGQDRNNMWMNVSLDDSIRGVRPYVGDSDIFIEFTIMQYIGLKDKNGKDVYDGDIVKYMSLVFPIIVDEIHGYRFTWGKDQINRAIPCRGKIIGNIYESPELLESQ